MKFLILSLVACLVLPLSATAFDGGWGEERWEYEEPDFPAPTAREPVNPYDYLPRGFEAQRQREYENQQYRSRYGGCANMYDNNPAAKEACLQGLGR